MAEPRLPRLNHLAMSVPAALLAGDDRRDIVAFYTEVFGWQEYPSETVEGKKLVMGLYRYDQFVFLIADDEPMRAPRMDHFGLGVGTLEELDDLYDRCDRYRRNDDRVELLDRSVEEHPGLTLTSFYVHYLLPLMVEVQHFALDVG